MTEDVLKIFFLELESFQIQNEKMMETNNQYRQYVDHLIEVHGQQNGFYHPFVRQWYQSVLRCIDYKQEVDEYLALLKKAVRS